MHFMTAVAARRDGLPNQKQEAAGVAPAPAGLSCRVSRAGRLRSTVLMLAIPAAVAGVPRLCAASPVMKGTDRIHPAVLCALDLAGVREIYAVGGAQAVAAFTWGTESISPVSLIVGPGNRYVTEAKRQCYGRVGIDFIAGPSEVLIVADGEADPSKLAADLLAQAEHDVNARSILVTTSECLGKEVTEEVERQLARLSTSAVARVSWENNGEILLADSPEEACRIANERAPEHLELDLAEPGDWIPRLRNYGSLFIGEWSAEVFGDYVSGTNHTLPTMGAARLILLLRGHRLRRRPVDAQLLRGGAFPVSVRDSPRKGLGLVDPVLDLLHRTTTGEAVRLFCRR